MGLIFVSENDFVHDFTVSSLFLFNMTFNSFPIGEKGFNL